MSLNRRIGYNCALAVDVLGGTTFVSVGSVVDGFSGAGPKSIMADISILTDYFTRTAPCGVDPGSFEFGVAYDPGDATSQLLSNLLASGAIANWQLTFYSVGGGGSGISETFLGYVETMGREIKRKSLVTAKVGIHIVGSPGYKLS